MENNASGPDRPTVVVPVTDIDRGVEEFRALGFGLVRIGPADSPAYAELVAGGVRLRLELAEGDDRHPHLRLPTVEGLTVLADERSVRPPAERARWTSRPAVVVNHPDEVVHPGRAGLAYRDLIPDRWGGAVIASHINVPEDGPVADYVHHHRVGFQLIYCHRGWVDVTYQDQGPSRRLEAGDLFLQPPGLRHRVDRAGDNLWVLEVTAPADHPTLADEGLTLPNGNDPGRTYGGQRFLHHVSADVPWTRLGESSERQDHGLEEATGGVARSQTWRCTDRSSGSSTVDLAEIGDRPLRFVFVLDGSADVTVDGSVHRLATDASIAVPGELSGSVTIQPGARLFVLSADLSEGGLVSA